VAGAAAFLAWLGAAVVVLSDGRRGLALGTGVATLALAVIVWLDAGPFAAAAVAAGGLASAGRRLMVGHEGWGIMPPGSTPRFILCVAGGLVALWIALGMTSGHSSALRFAILAVAGLAGARMLGSEDHSVLLTVVALLALAIAAAAGLAPGTPAIWLYVVAAAIAAGVGWLPVSAPRAA
jgi:hypothetical protein